MTNPTHLDSKSESEVVVEIEQQIYSYLDLCALYETKPSVLGFAQHLTKTRTR